jgi:hypothetical protein
MKTPMSERRALTVEQLHGWACNELMLNERDVDGDSGEVEVAKGILALIATWERSHWQLTDVAPLGP